VHHLPKEIVMTAEDMVDAALVGLDHGELVTIPPLADDAEWNRFEAARRAMIGRLSSAVPAARYTAAQGQSV
jgi:short-subunit dehydrogenase